MTDDDPITIDQELAEKLWAMIDAVRSKHPDARLFGDCNGRTLCLDFLRYDRATMRKHGQSFIISVAELCDMVDLGGLTGHLASITRKLDSLAERAA